MKKFAIAAVAASLALSAILAPKPAQAAAPVLPAAGAALGTGASWTAGFIGFVGVLALYDLTRRSSCAGDFLGLGGPGFTRPITVTDNVFPVLCKPAKGRR